MPARWPRYAAAMQQGAQTEAFHSASSAAGFAGVLASLTAPAPHAFDGLEDDVATLSYERALHTHARYRPAAEPAPGMEPSLSANSPRATPPPLPQPTGKRASVTVRMSTAECAQLHRRATEAGMTVSAYLRSCTFEAEALRAQVKQALAALKAAQAAQRSRRPFRWLRIVHRTAGPGS